MNTDKLQQDLAMQQYTFDTAFSSRLMRRIQNTVVLPDLSWLISSIAASILLGVVLVYLQDGELSYDSILGLETFKNDLLNEYSPYN